MKTKGVMKMGAIHKRTWVLLLLAGLPLEVSQGQTLVREYIYAGNRLIATVIATDGPLPTITSLTANPLSGTSTTITVIVSGNPGYANLGVINLLVNSFLDGRYACYVAVVPSGNGATVYLVDDFGNAGGPYASVAIPGSTGQASNSQCTISAVGSSISMSGNQLTVSLKITFNISFAGAKVIYAAARDLAGQNSGWQPAGTFFVGTPTFSVSPSAGTGASQTFSFTLAPPSGGSWSNSSPIVKCVIE